MKKYEILDITKNDWFEEVFDAKSEQEAIHHAEYKFGYLTPDDLENRESFSLIYGELNEDGFVDLDTAKEIKCFYKK